MKNKIIAVLGKKGREPVNIKRINKGYIANSCIAEIKGEKYFVKEFKENKLKKSLKWFLKHYGEKVTSEGYKKTHIRKIEKLSKIKNNYVKSPAFVKYKDNILVQEYVKGNEFYSHLIKNCSKMNKTFYEIGRFIAEFHNKNFIKYDNKGRPVCEIHGDLNSKNIKFAEKKAIILDPGIISGNIYKDIAIFVLNLYPVNIMYGFMVSRKCLDKLKQEFIKGYKNKSRFKIKDSYLKEHVIKQLENEKKYISKNWGYMIKKFIINSYINHLARKIKNGKIQI